MSVKFRVQSGFNFSSDSYAMVFNTSGSGVTPLPIATQNNYAGYSLAIIVGGSGGVVQAEAYDFYRPANSAQVPVFYPIVTTPQDLTFLQNSNGLGTEFTVEFARSIALFNVTATATPSASPATSVRTNATTSPSASPSASPTATASGVTVGTDWNFNFFVLSGQVTEFESEGNLQIIDSLGSGGPNDTTYQSPTLNTATDFDITFYVQAGSHPSIPDALTGGEIANAP